MSHSEIIDNDLLNSWVWLAKNAPETIDWMSVSMDLVSELRKTREELKWTKGILDLLRSKESER